MSIMEEMNGNNELQPHPMAGGERPSVPEFYAGKHILITGATGFMGKVLVEKLLRDCQDIKCLYLLIRAKKGVDPEERKEQYLKCLVFEKILDKNPDLTSKIKVIKGDVLENDLGLSENDRNELISNVDIIFHCAANVRFDQPLRPMIEMNLAGTQKMLQLAEMIGKLKAFVHVSTSYCQCNETVLEERGYPPAHDPIGILQMTRTLDDKNLAKLTPELIEGQPNTYAYSKSLTEGLIQTYGNKLPIVICRPSIVTAARKEPIPGWIEGVNGPTGLMIGAARGVIRSMHCNPDYPATVVPVDTAINAVIVAGWDRALTQSDKVEFYNVCLSSKTLPSWGEAIETGKRFFYEYPLCFSLWYPDGSIKKSFLAHWLCVVFFHYLPAYVIDFLLLICGQKPFLIRVQKKISTGLELLQYYTTKSWEFKNERMQALNAKLSPIDQETFEITVDQINWEDYIKTYINGMRLFILNEGLETIPKAKVLLRRLYILDRLVNYTLYAIIFWFLWSRVDGLVEYGGSLLNLPFDIFSKHTRIVSDASGAPN